MDGVGDDTFDAHKSLFEIRARYKARGQEVWFVQYPEYDARVVYLCRAFVFPVDGSVPEAAFNLEESEAGRFFGAHRNGQHINLGQVPDDCTIEMYLERADKWLEDYFGSSSLDVVRLD